MKQGRDGHGEGEEVNTRKGKGERIPYILEHGYAYGVGLQTRTFHFQYNCDIPVIHYAQIEQTRAKKKRKKLQISWRWNYCTRSANNVAIWTQPFARSATCMNIASWFYWSRVGPINNSLRQKTTKTNSNCCVMKRQKRYKNSTKFDITQ